METVNLKNKRILLRADLNVPLQNGKIIDDHRLQEILPTIDLIQKHGGKVILITHIGRPKEPTPALSTKNLVPWFKKHEYQIDFEPNLERAQKKSNEFPEKVLLLENLRFFPGEQSKDTNFAQQLAQLGDIYINDAFGALHRNDSSITLLPQLFKPENRTLGLLVEKELQMLDKLKTNHNHPFVAILGGAKISSKIPILQTFIEIADTILLCPAIVFTFLKALGKPIGKSLVDDTLLQTTKEIMEKAKKYKTKLVFPLDYQIADKTFDGPLSILDSTNIPPDAFGISIGPKTEKLFAAEIKQAQTVFFNGALGNPEKEKTLEGTRVILSAMADSQAFTIIGGGDTVGVARKFNLDDKISFCSTGGGSTLAYLAGQHLPGLKDFQSK